MLGVDRAAILLRDPHTDSSVKTYCELPNSSSFFLAAEGGELVFFKHPSGDRPDKLSASKQEAAWTLKLTKFQAVKAVSGLEHSSISCAMARSQGLIFTGARVYKQCVCAF